MNETLLERLNVIAEGSGLTGVSLMLGVNFEWDCPEDAVTAARAAIIAEYGYISESIIDEILAVMDDSDLYND